MAAITGPRVLIDRKSLEAFCVRALVKSGASVRHAEISARVLVLADRVP
jgi:LDH2 family malate/lactate/ureidoglycolate dehydrogenase